MVRRQAVYIFSKRRWASRRSSICSISMRPGTSGSGLILKLMACRAPVRSSPRTPGMNTATSVASRKVPCAPCVRRDQTTNSRAGPQHQRDRRRRTYAHTSDCGCSGPPSVPSLGPSSQLPRNHSGLRRTTQAGHYLRRCRFRRAVQT